MLPFFLEKNVQCKSEKKDMAAKKYETRRTVHVCQSYLLWNVGALLWYQFSFFMIFNDITDQSSWKHEGLKGLSYVRAARNRTEFSMDMR